MKLIVGLGNPGARYARTRHNVGFDVADELARRLRWSWEVGRGKAMVASGHYRAAITPPRPARPAGNAEGAPDARSELDSRPELDTPPEPVIREEKLLLAKPQMYMNLSGVSVSELMRFYKLDRGDLLIVCDDLDLPLGRVRLRARGAAGGQHGLESTIKLLGTSDFARLKIGIGRPAHGRDENVDFLLSPPRGDERIALDDAIQRAADASLVWALEGPEVAMNRFNR
ncbi:MAG TPA: aminoacyl-tRNA hydrolase [Ktedonobacterales bacterium]|nr:aminoacyl-tRNA hydrolase [Ktedonobacterales bacterium]